MSDPMWKVYPLCYNVHALKEKNQNTRLTSSPEIGCNVITCQHHIVRISQVIL